MPGSAPFRLNRSGVMLALVSAAFAGEAGAAAGRTEFIVGPVTVAGRDGIQRPLTRGIELDNGDVVRTNDGRAQIRFTDGAYVSLQPNTEFGIRDYLYENKTDGSEKGFFGLVKGAMRTVTGLIGRVNRDRYQITTPTATVGIRGTGGVIQVQPDGSTLVIGTSGIWSLTNPSGSIDVPAGVSGLAPSDPNQPPSDTTQQPTSGPAPLPEEEPQFTQGEERTATGDPIVGPTFAPLVSGPGYAAVLPYGEDAGGGSFNPHVDATSSANAVFNAAGELTQLTSSTYRLDAGGSHADFGSDGILAWGRWIGPVFADVASNQSYNQNQGFHYVIGMPTPMLPTSGTATYSLLGASRPTHLDGSTSPGTFSGSISVTFSSIAIVGVDFTVAMPNRTYGLNGSTSTSSASFSLATQFENLNITGCSSCVGFIGGFFAGANAERAGVGYHIGDFETRKDVVGAAALKKD